MERLKKFTSHGIGQTAIYAASIGATKIVALIMLPVFTHFLSPEEYAKLDIIQTLANVLSVVIGFGLADALFRFTGEQERKQAQKHVASGIFGLALICSLLSLILFQLLAPYISEYIPGNITLIDVRIILASLSFTGCVLVPLAWLRFENKANTYFMSTFGRNAFQAALAAGFLYMGFGVTGVLFAGLLAVVILTISLCRYQYKQTGISFSWQILEKQGRYGGVLVLAGVAAFALDCFDRWVLAAHVDLVKVAQYALACKIGIMAAFLSEPYRMWWSARRFGVLFGEGGPEVCALNTERGILIAVLSAIGIAGVGGIVVHLLSDGDYLGAVAYVPLIAGISALNAVVNLMNISVLADERTLKPIIIDGFAASIAVTGYFLLIPVHGVHGAITATYVAQLVRLISYVYFGQKFHPIPYRFHIVIIYLLAASVVVVSVLQITEIWKAFGLSTSAGVVLVAMAIKVRTISLPAEWFGNPSKRQTLK